MTTPGGGGNSGINLATLWIPVLPSTDQLGPKLREAGELGRKSFEEGFSSGGSGSSIFDKMTASLGSQISQEVSAGLQRGLSNMELPGGMSRVTESLMRGMEGVAAHTEKAEQATKSYERAHTQLTAALEREAVAQARLDDLRAKGAQGAQMVSAVANLEQAHRRVASAADADSQAHEMLQKTMDAGSSKMLTFAASTGIVSGAISGGIVLAAEALTKGSEAAVEGFGKIIELGEEVVKEGIEIGEAFENMHRQIELSTVAGGSALDELKSHSDALVASLDTSTDKLGTDIATLSTRLHMEAGPELDALTKSVTELRDRFGALDTSALAGAFVQFGVDGEHANQTLASLVHSAREYGVSLGGLVNDLATAGPALTEFDLTIEQSGHLLAELSAQHINAAGAVTALTRAEKGASEQHIQLKDFVQQELTIIEKYVAANNTQAAQQEAFLAFGARSWKEATAAAHAYLETVNAGPNAYKGNTAEMQHLIAATQSLENRYTALKNSMTTSFAPVASLALEGINTAVSKLGSWIQSHQGEVLDFVKRLGTDFINAIPAVQEFVAKTLEAIEPWAKMVQWAVGTATRVFGELIGVASQLDKLPIFKHLFGDFSKELHDAADMIAHAGNEIRDFNLGGTLDGWSKDIRGFRPDIQGWTSDINESTDALRHQLDALNDAKGAAGEGVGGAAPGDIGHIAPPAVTSDAPADGGDGGAAPGGADGSSGGEGGDQPDGGATPVQPRSWHMKPPDNNGVGGPHVMSAGWHPRVEQVDNGQYTEKGGGAPKNPGERDAGGGEHHGGERSGGRPQQRTGPTPEQDRSHQRRLEDLGDRIDDASDSIVDLSAQQKTDSSKLAHDKALRDSYIEGSLAWINENKIVVADSKEMHRVTKELNRTLRERQRAEEDIQGENEKYADEKKGGRGKGGRDSDRSPAHDFGSQFLGGIADDLGLGGIFGKSPLEWGLPKLVKGILSAGSDSDDSSGGDDSGGDSGGNPITSFLRSLFGQHGEKTLPDAPHAGTGAPPGPHGEAVLPGAPTAAAAPGAPPSAAQHPTAPTPPPPSGDGGAPGAATPVPTPHAALPPGVHFTGYGGSSSGGGGGGGMPSSTQQFPWSSIPAVSGGTSGAVSTVGSVMPTAANYRPTAQLASAAGGKGGAARTIYDGVVQAGYSPKTATAAVAAAQYESGLDPTIQEKGGSDHWGLFQEQGNYAGAHGSAGDQTNWFVDQLNRLGGPSVVDRDPTNMIADRVEIGGYSGSKYDMAGAQQLLAGLGADPAAGGGAPYAPAAYPSGAMPAGMPALDNPNSVASRVPNAPNVEKGIAAMGGLPTLYDTSGPNAYKVPAWAQQLAGQFGLTASTYASGGSLHQMGYAFDFNGAQPNMDAFADYVQGNLSPQTLQLIHASGNRRWGIASGQDVSGSGYYAGDYGGHFDHVHWATDVPPIMAGQPVSTDDSIVADNPSRVVTAGYRPTGAVNTTPVQPPTFPNIPNINPMAGVPHLGGPSMTPGPAQSSVSNGENVQHNTPQQQQNLQSGVAGLLGSLIGGPDFNPRNWQGILHTPDRQQGMQHSGGASVQHITQNFDHSIDMSGSTVADPRAMRQQMQEAQNARLYSVLGGLPTSGVGSP